MGIEGNSPSQLRVPYVFPNTVVEFWNLQYPKRGQSHRSFVYLHEQIAWTVDALVDLCSFGSVRSEDIVSVCDFYSFKSEGIAGHYSSGPSGIGQQGEAGSTNASQVDE